MQKRADGGFRYVRRVPARALAMLRRHDPNCPDTIRRSLDTHSRDEARAKRDAMEKADNGYWATVEAGDAPAVNVYERAIARARSLRVEYRPAAELARDASLDEILHRISMISGPADRVTADAVLGGAGEKSTTIDQAFGTFEKVIRKADLARKSPWQLLKWRQLKQRGIANFKREVGDIPIEQITRADALKFHAYWLGRIVPDEDEDGEKPAKALSASAGNKDMDTMRALFGEYMAHIGREDVPNPFRSLRFKDRMQRTRPSFTEDWIRKHILKAGALDGLNTEARLAVLALINTGARPSEIVNLDADRILLEAKVPYIDIRETMDRELKVVATARRIPLAGVSLEAMREARNGFAKYRDKDNLSATVNKFFRENGLMESEEHTLYSLRHGFEARLKLAEVDEELRRYLMGHAIRRPKYGYSEDLRWSFAAIHKVAL
ncbi:tyrosine-type recombinase/integrase [Mesorhizobium sp. KR2-14]|uniref:tyrosine-type recombinase/integrase n=1 Tax=Mesorhizobium sp. KR2-14 TaxID=3156610 RepID=UPI0032B5C329